MGDRKVGYKTGAYGGRALCGANFGVSIRLGGEVFDGTRKCEEEDVIRGLVGTRVARGDMTH